MRFRENSWVVQLTVCAYVWKRVPFYQFKVFVSVEVYSFMLVSDVFSVEALFCKNDWPLCKPIFVATSLRDMRDLILASYSRYLIGDWYGKRGLYFLQVCCLFLQDSQHFTCLISTLQCNERQ